MAKGDTFKKNGKTYVSRGPGRLVNANKLSSHAKKNVQKAFAKKGQRMDFSTGKTYSTGSARLADKTSASNPAPAGTYIDEYGIAYKSKADYAEAVSRSPTPVAVPTSRSATPSSTQAVVQQATTTTATQQAQINQAWAVGSQVFKEKLRGETTKTPTQNVISAIENPNYVVKQTAVNVAESTGVVGLGFVPAGKRKTNVDLSKANNIQTTDSEILKEATSKKVVVANPAVSVIDNWNELDTKVSKATIQKITPSANETMLLKPVDYYKDGSFWDIGDKITNFQRGQVAGVYDFVREKPLTTTAIIGISFATGGITTMSTPFIASTATGAAAATKLSLGVTALAAGAYTVDTGLAMYQTAKQENSTFWDIGHTKGTKDAPILIGVASGFAGAKYGQSVLASSAKIGISEQQTTRITKDNKVFYDESRGSGVVDVANKKYSFEIKDTSTTTVNYNKGSFKGSGSTNIKINNIKNNELTTQYLTFGKGNNKASYGVRLSTNTNADDFVEGFVSKKTGDIISTYSATNKVTQDPTNLFDDTITYSQKFYGTSLSKSTQTLDVTTTVDTINLNGVSVKVDPFTIKTTSYDTISGFKQNYPKPTFIIDDPTDNIITPKITKGKINDLSWTDDLFNLNPQPTNIREAFVRELPSTSTIQKGPWFELKPISLDVRPAKVVSGSAFSNTILQQDDMVVPILSSTQSLKMTAQSAVPKIVSSITAGAIDNSVLMGGGIGLISNVKDKTFMTITSPTTTTATSFLSSTATSTIQGIVPIVSTKPALSTATSTASALVQQPTATTITQQTLTTPTPFAPQLNILPTPTPVLLPPLPSLPSGSFFKFKQSKPLKIKQSKKYTPTFTAAAFGIKSKSKKQKKFDALTGLGLRGV